MNANTQRDRDAWQLHLQQGNTFVMVELNETATYDLAWRFAKSNGCEVTSEGGNIVRISTTDRTLPSRTELLRILKIYNERMYTGYDVSNSIRALIQDLEDEESGE